MKRYLKVTDEGALLGHEKKEVPEGKKECEKCLGHGGWNLRVDAYGEGKHFECFCSGCMGWGSVNADLKEYRQDKLDRIKDLLKDKLIASNRTNGYAHKTAIVTLKDATLRNEIDKEVLLWCADEWWLLNFGGVIRKLSDTKEGYSQWSVKVYTD